MNQKINWLRDIKNAWCLFYGVKQPPLAVVAVKFLEDAYKACGGDEDAITCFSGVFDSPSGRCFKLCENKWIRFS